MEFNYFDAFEDDIEVVELVEVGIPRQIYSRRNYFEEFPDLRFFQRFRLTKETVAALLEEIAPQLEFTSNRNNGLSPINQLLTTLRFYSTGGHLSSIADFMGIHEATASRVVARVSQVLAALYRTYVKIPQNVGDLRNIQNHFYEISRFPKVVAAVDGTHIKIQSPGGENAEVFRNRKDYFSINVQALCNANLEFLDVVARWPGSTHDVTIFNNSRIRQKFEDRTYPDCLILGDSGYNVRPYLFTPLLNPQTEAEQLYNEAHIRTRNVVERAFGVWKRRFPILAYGCRVKEETTLNLIIACAVLHNVACRINEGEPPLPEEIDRHELQALIRNGQIPNVPPQNGGNDHRGVGGEVRRAFINTFFANL